jgi:hypothetical protein
MFNIPTLLHQTKGGSGQQVATIPWISSDFTAFSTPETYGAVAPGQYWYDEFGNAFSLRQARAAGVVQGACVKWNTTAADTVAAAPTVTAIGLTAGSPYSGANAEVGNLLWVKQIATGAVGTNKFQSVKFIKANAAGAGGFFRVSMVNSTTANLQADPDAFATVPVAGNDVQVFRPYEILVSATTDLLVVPCIGVAVQAVADTKWGFVQHEGLALTLSSGAVTAIVANNAVVLDGVTAGTVKGSASIAAGQVGISAVANDTIATVIPVWLTLRNNA